MSVTYFRELWCVAFILKEEFCCQYHISTVIATLPWSAMFRTKQIPLALHGGSLPL